MTINVELSEESLDEAIMAVQVYRDSIDQKASRLVGDLATQVEEYATYELSKHIWTGETIASLQKNYKIGAMTAEVLVGGAAVWLEFGTGVVANPVGVGGFAHPKAAELGMYGIGEYGHGHGADPNGWWYYDEEGRKRHTFGIPATMFMYHSAWNARRDLPNLARRIFRT